MCHFGGDLKHLTGKPCVALMWQFSDPVMEDPSSKSKVQESGYTVICRPFSFAFNNTNKMWVDSKALGLARKYFYALEIIVN